MVPEVNQPVMFMIGILFSKYPLQTGHIMRINIYVFSEQAKNAHCVPRL